MTTTANESTTTTTGTTGPLVRDQTALEREAVLVRPHLSQVRVPSSSDRVYKDECVYSFDTPTVDAGSDPAAGLYVCLKTFRGVGHDFVQLHHDLTGSTLFLHLRHVRYPVIEPKNADMNSADGTDPAMETASDKSKPTRLAIGLEGGFDADPDAKKWRFEDENSLLVLAPGTGGGSRMAEIRLPNPQLPELVLQSIAGILTATSASTLAQLEATSGTWDGEARAVSQHAATLVQLNNDVKVPPTGWQCSVAGCDKRDNLWLNLSDGAILCGRKFFDGSGGNNHAVEHFQATGYPLAVKLGTISGDGAADVFSYAEDDMVLDPLLGQHLAHFGINMASMRKTEKSMAELEIDLNSKVNEWAVIQEEGSSLEPLYGPGYTGLTNLGNSCYMNSVLQVLFSLPEFAGPFRDPQAIYRRYNGDPTQDLGQQLAKISFGLLSGRYSAKPADLSKDPSTGQWSTKELQLGIKPVMFKTLVGRGHAEFSTKHQQDAQEFFLHLMQLIERNAQIQPSIGNPAGLCFKFRVEERVECATSHRVSYRSRTEFLIPLPIPLDRQTNRDEVTQYEARVALLAADGKPPPVDRVRPRIPLAACLESFATPEEIDDFYSTAISGKTRAIKRTRLTTFPSYLVLQLKKFTIGSDWTPQKLDVSIDVPDELDLTHLRGAGLQEGEEELPEATEGGVATGTDPVAPQPAIDESVVRQLTEMGFSANACRRALLATQNCGPEPAMNWIMEHMGDPDFDAPLELATRNSGTATSQSAAPVATTVEVDEEGLQLIVAMGFSRSHAARALRETNNDKERAVDWIFSHPDEPMDEVTAGGPAASAAAVGTGPSASTAEDLSDGPGRYRLAAFISHMGTSTMCGHYVAHIRKSDRWTIFNDEKVAVSERPPKDLAYIYVYKRVDS